MASADLEIGRQVVRPCLGEMELDKDISLSLSLSVSCIGILQLSLFSNSPEASAGNSLPFIERELRRLLKANPRFGGRIVSAMGMRAEESAARARKSPRRLNERNSRAGRTWFDWLPIFDLTERQVFRIIRDAGQSPHPAYAMGMSRLSCVFCIMASRADLRTAARLQPALYARYAEIERHIGHTLSPSDVPLPELTGISPASAGCDDTTGLNRA